MTTHSVYRLACDAPACPTVALVEEVSYVPPDWIKLWSADHVRDWVPGRVPGRGGRTRKDQRSRWDVWAGAFSLHLCPEHPGVFASHVPATEGSMPHAGATQGSRSVLVRCSCNFSTYSSDTILVASSRSGFEREPRARAHAAWWRHLPAELQEYAGRGRR